MNPTFIYAIGTLFNWLGWYFAFRTVVVGVKTATKQPSHSGASGLKWLLFYAGMAAVLLIVTSVLPIKSTTPSPEAWRFPIVWPAMPFTGWIVVLFGIATLTKAVQAGLSFVPADRIKNLTGFGINLCLTIAAVWVFLLDPSAKVELLTGGIPFSPGVGVALLFLALAATIAMVLSSKEAKSRGVAKSFAAQIALLVGSVVFGTPFVFLLVTSFKESEDMSSPSGIVWIPKVSQTEAFIDTRDPQFASSYNGDAVIGHVITHNTDGTVQFDILRPHSLAGISFTAKPSELKLVPSQAPLVQGTYHGFQFKGEVVEEMEDGRRRVKFQSPSQLAGQEHPFEPAQVTKIRKTGLNWTNYPEALEYLPAEAQHGLTYLENTLIIVVFGLVGTLLSSAIVAYAFSRMNFPGRNVLFGILLGTMMLPGAVTLLPTFLIFRNLHAINTLYPLWVPAFFGSAFNIFLLRQFFMQIPMELEDAAKIDGCSYFGSFWRVMLPQVKPALAVVAIWAFMAAWNNFMGPLIYISSPEHMPLSYALQLFQGDRSSDPGLVMAFATMCMVPVLLLFFFAQRYFIEGVTLSGLGGR